MSAISSPCRDICCLNDDTGLCEGCGRTISEIAQWTSLTEAARKSIMEQVPQRLAGSTGD